MYLLQCSKVIFFFSMLLSASPMEGLKLFIDCYCLSLLDCLADFVANMLPRLHKILDETCSIGLGFFIAQLPHDGVVCFVVNSVKCSIEEKSI